MKKRALFSLLIVFILAVSLVSCGEKETPTTEIPQRPGNGNFDGTRMMGGGLMDIIAEATGLTMPEMQEQTANGEKTLADIITENGGDVDAVKAQLIEAFAEMPQRDGQEINVEEMVDNMLNGTGAPFPGGGGRMGGGGGGQGNGQGQGQSK